MQVYRDIEHLPPFHNAVVTIGTFDGVHLGHQRIIKQLKEEAASIGGETVIITFNPHPREVIKNDTHAIRLLNTVDEKIGLLKNLGINHLVIVPFTKAFSQYKAGDYVREFLVKRFHPKRLIIGYDHRFGKDREGNYRLLEEMGKEFDFQVREIPEHVINEVTISSTKIRSALLQGNIEEANLYLGYDYFFEGLVKPGDKRGRTIGFPTANLEIISSEKLIPGNGVYAVRVEQIGLPVLSSSQFRLPSDFSYAGMMNIGIRPTVGGIKRTIEVHLFDFVGDLYNSTLLVSMKYFLRPEEKFGSLELLREQLEKDRLIAQSKLR